MKTTRTRLPSPLLVAPLLLVLLLGSCAPRPPLPAPSRAVAFKEWLPALRERSEHWQRYQARVRLKAQTGDKRFNLEAMVLANLPDQFRLEAFRLGQTVGVLILDRGQSSLFVPSEKVLYRAAHSEDLTNHLLGIALPLDDFGYSLSATLPPARLEGFEIAPWRQEWLGQTRSSGDGWSSVWHFSPEPQAVTSVRVQRGGWDYSIRYEPSVGLAVDQIPQKIVLTSAEWLIEATVQELQPVSNLQEAAFQSDFGKEVRWVEIR